MQSGAREFRESGGGGVEVVSTRWGTVGPPLRAPGDSSSGLLVTRSRACVAGIVRHAGSRCGRVVWGENHMPLQPEFNLRELPDDVVAIVLQHISESCFVDLFRVANACSRFRRLLMNEPRIRRTLVLPRSLLLCEVVLDILQHEFNHLNLAVQRLHVAHVALDAHVFAAAFPAMRTLVVDNHDGPIRFFEPGAFPHVQELAIQNSIYLCVDDLPEDIERAFPNLRELTLKAIHPLLRVPFRLPKLRRLNLECGTLSRVSHSYLQFADCQLKLYEDTVEVLDISDNFAPRDELLAFLSMFGAYRLRELRMRNFMLLSRRGENVLDLSSFTELERLDASHCSGLHSLVVTSPKLTHLELNGSRDVSNVELNSTRLAYVDFRGCPELVLGKRNQNRLAKLASSCSVLGHEETDC